MAGAPLSRRARRFIVATLMFEVARTLIVVAVCMLVPATLAIGQAPGPAEPGTQEPGTQEPGTQEPRKQEPEAAPANEGAPGQAPPAPSNGSGAPDVPAGPWAKLRSALRSARSARRAELTKRLEPYLPDLVLRFEENAPYLKGRFAEIRKLDPELPEALLPLLFTTEDPAEGSKTEGRGRNGAGQAERGRRHIAENVLRILRPMELRPWAETLRRRAADGPLEERLRALDLLATVPGEDVAPQLQQLLPITPENHIPHLLRIVGRSGATALAPLLVPFLERPKEEQRLGAMQALAALGYAQALPKLRETAVALDSPAGWQTLLAALTKLTPGGEAPAGIYAETLATLLTRGQRLSRLELLEAVALAQRFDPSGEEAVRRPLLEALTALLDHPFPRVTFEAAIALRHLGSESGVELVLERLDDSVKKNRRVPYVYVQRARAYEAFDMTREALRDIKDAIRYSTKGTVTPDLYFFAARLETKRGNASQVYQLLRDADATPEELRRFREEMQPHGFDELLERHLGLKRLFEG